MNKQELIEKYNSKLNTSSSLQLLQIYKEFIRELMSLDEPEKVKVPQFVADWYEENKDVFEANLYRCAYNIPSVFDGAKLNEFERWFLTAVTKPFQTLVNMHQFGYEVEKEPRYTVKVKSTKCSTKSLMFSILTGEWFFSVTNYQGIRFKHTRKQLEEADFGWVFDCPGIEIEEVQDET